MLPTFHKRCLSVVFAAFLSLLVAGPVQAASRPKMKAAYAVDRDHDGHVDGVSLKWSKRVRGGADRTAPFAFKVRGYHVTGVGAARGKSQQLRVAERPECDTGGSVRLAYRKRKGATRMKRVRSHKLDMRRFDVPVPRITCAVTLDADADGRVDGVRVTYSREVKSDAQTGGRFLFSVAGYKIKTVKAARERFLEIDVAEHPATDSGAKPAIGYSAPVKRSLRRFAVRAGKRENAFSGSYQSTKDGVSPQLVSGKTADTDADGLLDAMTVRFSEPVQTAGASGIAVLGMRVRENARANGADVSLSLVENTALGNARPGAWVAGPGVTDLAGNAPLRKAVTPADGAAPVMTGAITQDARGTAGRLDAVTVGFSEPIAHPRDAGGRYPFLLGGRAVSSVEPASGRTVQVRFAEASTSDTGDRPSVRYLPGSGLPVADAAGNEATQGFVSALDGVAPVLVSASTGDGDADGKLGSVLMRFSEDVVHGAEAGNSSFAVDGYDVTAAAAASDDQISLTMTEQLATDSGATPTVTYTRDGVEDVRDAAGNLTGGSSRTASDGARPVLLTAATGDVDDDGRIDRLATTWSEPLTNADDTSAPFAVSASGFSVSRVRAATGASLAIDLTEPSGYDTGSTPAVTYVGGTANIRDAGGLEPAKKTWAGLTVDALDPRLISATTGDGDADGQVDSIAVRFSEDVVHTQEATPGSFTAGAFTISSAEAASADSVELQLLQSGTPDTGARPAVSYTPDGLDDVSDSTGNFADAASIAQATDGARPVLVSAATADTDDNGKLDRVTTGWSEPLDHADDDVGPFPLAAEMLAVTHIHAAAGPTDQTLDVDRAEPAAPDTGSAPDLTYTSDGDPIQDMSGLEPANKTYAGVTRDALPPRLVSTATVDEDHNGKLDAVDIEWSETVTGASDYTPFTVSGRTLGANVTFNGATTRVPLAEVDPSEFDTDATPDVTYDADAGDLKDEPEPDAVTDTAQDAPSVAAETLDKAAPILVAAETADRSTPGGGDVPNGTIDAVRTTFSEPITQTIDGVPPFSLNVAGRNEQSVEGETGAGNTMLAVVSESVSPDGGETPNVSVTGSGDAADRIKDLAANDARVMTFTGTTDEVRPVLVSAQLGESEGPSGCTNTPEPGIDGQVDCVRATWSEDVQIADDTDGSFSIASDGWGVFDPDGPGPLGGIPQQGPAKTLTIPLTPAGSADRDRSGTSVSYAELNDLPVEDMAAKESLDGSVMAEPPCRDKPTDEGNDVRDPSNPRLNTTSASFQRKCAFDADWYVVETTADGFLEVVTRPSPGLDLDFELRDGANGLVDPDIPALETGAAGELDRRTYSGLSPSTSYYLLVKPGTDENAAPQEGPYCVVFADAPDLDPGCGPLTGQIVFTEAGFGDDKFVEIKNDVDVPVDMAGSGAELAIGPANSPRATCILTMPTNSVNAIIDPNEHVLVEQTASASSFGCDKISSLAAGGERLELKASGSIDVVDFTGIIDSPYAASHSLQFVEADDADATANDDVVTRWCRTFAANTKMAVGDGCDEYRINEVLRTTAEGNAFVELFGNIPAVADSELLGGWVLGSVDGLTGDGAYFPLSPTASPRTNGTYVIADGVSEVTQVSPSDVVWDSLDLAFVAGTRGLQLLRPDPPASPPCTSSADAFGWTTIGRGFSTPLDDLRGCPGVEVQEYTNNITPGASAARDNLSDAGDTAYNENFDTGNNRNDFCPQAPPNPAQLNFGRIC